MHKQVIVVGTGKLATELLGALHVAPECQLSAWAGRENGNPPSIVVHAGSGRELDAVMAYCEASASPLIELATGSKVGASARAFPVVVCPNTNLLMLKFMCMLEQSGHLFHGEPIRLVESHQAQKTSVAGTAISMAQALGLHATDIQSVRDPEVQRTELHIPAASLGRHAYHQIRIADGACSLTFESRVEGDAPYADGVSRIIAAVQERRLDNRLYTVMEFIRQGWL